ncbi:MAG: hypothetical protein KF864_06445 [Phycisphaeraceae bacterium]|nr:hypothetical protein [Phycisphaeraceae bacterium]
MPHPSSTSISLVALLLAAAAATAQPVSVTSPLTINPGDTTILGVPLATAEITVRGTTLTINGRHAIASLAVIRSDTNQPGIVTHANAFTFDYAGDGSDIVHGMHLIIAGTLYIEGADGALVASRFDLNGRGFAAAQGPGAGAPNNTSTIGTGASHGGLGGGNSATSLGGTPYGSVYAPALLGSGGGFTSSGGRGGGAARIDTSATIHIDGLFTANAQSTTGNGGGGSGGSIFITCPAIVGEGTISADGGAVTGTGTGAGGGGRISIVALGIDFNGTIRAHGGASPTSSRKGGPGTVYLKAVGEPVGTIIISDVATNGQGAALDSAEPYQAHIIVRSGGAVTPGLSGTLRIESVGDIILEPGSLVNASSRGFFAAQGPGAGTPDATNEIGSGASHGGRGGDTNARSGGPTYGSILEPTELGSGGGYNNGGGRGGGAVRLIAVGMLTIDGEINADAGNATSSNGGGGSGGSIWATAADLNGNGLVSAGGSATTGTGTGGGGGGRIALTAHDAFTFTGEARAYGGSAGTPSRRGGPGTVYMRLLSEPLGELIIDDVSTDGMGAVLDTDEPLPANLTILDGGKVTPPASGTTHIQLQGALAIAPGGMIEADARGFGPAQGPGAGAPNSASLVGSGAGHGGRGGSTSSLLGGITYGSIFEPIDMGSGGGFNNGSGRGGGAIRVSAGGPAHISGTITASGGNTTNFNGGGGSGGSIWIDAASITGDGIIRADGGSPTSVSTGGGGGGRIALYADSFGYSGTIRAFGGPAPNDARKGGPGTIYMKLNTEPLGDIIIDDDSTAGEGAVIESVDSLPVHILIRQGAKVTPPPSGIMTLAIDGDLDIEAGGMIEADARGFGAGQGPGAGLPNSNSAIGSGAGHGGIGGSSGLPGGPVCGSLTQPLLMGSGGGYLSGGGRGGGALRITTLGAMNINGQVSVAGGTPSNGLAGGGAGGSIFLTASSLTGSGTIAARGGGTTGASAGAGGGGRIAIYSCDVQMPIANITSPGGLAITPSRNGGDGTVSFGSSTIQIGQQPQGGIFRGGDFFQLSVQASGDGEISYQWRTQNESGEFIPLDEGQEGVFFEVNSNTLFVAGIDCAGTGFYDCLVCDSCGCFPTNAVEIFVEAPGDFNQDGGIDGADVEAFFAAWENGDPEADINLDGGIDGADVDFFFDRWERGC